MAGIATRSQRRGACGVGKSFDVDNLYAVVCPVSRLMERLIRFIDLFLPTVVLKCQVDCFASGVGVQEWIDLRVTIHERLHIEFDRSNLAQIRSHLFSV